MAGPVIAPSQNTPIAIDYHMGAADNLPEGWSFSYTIDDPDGPRLAVLSKEVLRKSVDRGFRSALANLPLLKYLAQPVAVFRGIRRLRYFDGEADWASAVKMLIAVTCPQFARGWERSRFVETAPPDHSVFVAYLYENEPIEMRQRWQRVLGLGSCPNAKICGYEWVGAGLDRLPREWGERYDQRLR